MIPLRLNTTLTLMRGGMLAILAITTACGSSNSDRSPSSDSIALEAGATRQPIPAGIDPRMVEWRTDGVLIASQDSLQKTPGYVIDSVFPPEEAMRRFREEIAETPPNRLRSDFKSTDALLRAYWTRLVAADSTDIADLAVTKAEFAYLYLPGSVEVNAGMQPSTAWILLEQNSSPSLARAMGRATDRRNARVESTVCSREKTTESTEQLRTIGPCGVVLTTGASRDTLWIASRVVEHRGIVKLLSFANSF